MLGKFYSVCKCQSSLIGLIMLYPKYQNIISNIRENFFQNFEILHFLSCIHVICDI